MNDDDDARKFKLALMRKYGRPSYTRDGRQGASYTAIDPAIETFACRCGKQECLFARLQTFRKHIALLYRAISVCEEEGYFKEIGWRSVLYPLQMAASLEDIYADTAYVDDTEAVVYCSSVAAYEAANTEIACKYISGLSIFTFLWAAYEAAITLTFPDRLNRLSKEGKLGERGRRLFEGYASDFPELIGLENLARLSEHLCERGGLFDERLQRIRSRHSQRNLVFSAELCREFRNFIVHGEDEVPPHEAWHSYRPPGEATARIRRFYAISRMLLLLIQTLAAAGLSKSTKEIEGLPDDERGPQFSDPKLLFIGLHIAEKELEYTKNRKNN